MKPWINYQHLLYFKTIATEGSIVKAADKLRLGQPTLSAQLKQFEETIGVKRFDRRHKKLMLHVCAVDARGQGTVLQEHSQGAGESLRRAEVQVAANRIPGILGHGEDDFANRA